MLTQAQAHSIARKQMPPGSRIVRTVPLEKIYVIQINWPDEAEGNFLPFFSVDKETGAFMDYDIEEGGVDLIRRFAG